METVLTGQRLTWEQICAAYPDQWVALTDIKYMDDDEIKMLSIGGLKRAGEKFPCPF